MSTATTSAGKIGSAGGTRSSSRGELLSLLNQQVAVAAAGRTGWSADLAVIELYSMHYPALVQLAATLVRDTATAEEVVQDAFIAMQTHDAWDRLGDTEKALSYLRKAVVNGSSHTARALAALRGPCNRTRADLG